MTPVVEGVVVVGHGVASGRAPDTPFAGGTIALQAPHFAERGLDLSPFVPATINLDLAPHRLVPLEPRWTFRDVAWTDVHGPETFSFIEVRAWWRGRAHDGLVYLPHPETKPMHRQPTTVVELLLPRLDGLTPGDRIGLLPAPGQARVSERPPDVSRR